MQAIGLARERGTRLWTQRKLDEGRAGDGVLVGIVSGSPIPPLCERCASAAVLLTLQCYKSSRTRHSDHPQPYIYWAAGLPSQGAWSEWYALSLKVNSSTGYRVYSWAGYWG